MSSKNLRNAGTTIAEFVTVGGRGDQMAAAYMLISVLGFSVIPVVVALGGRESPLMFSAVLRLGSVMGYAGFLSLFYRRLLFRKTVWREVFRAIWASPLQLGGRTVYTFVPFLLATVTYFDYAFFAVSVHSIDVSVATVFYEAWPILLIALTGYLFNRERRYERTGWEVFVFSIMGFVGFAFVAASETGGLLIGAGGGELTRLGSGFGLLAIALVLAPLSAFGLRWGVDLGRRLEGVTGLEREYLSFFAVVMVNFLGNLAALPFILVASTVVLGESGLGWDHVVYGLLGGLVALTLANVAWRKVNLVTMRLGVNAMSYLTPLFGLFWIYLLSDFRPARMDYLVIGATVVLTSNLLINFAAEIRLGFRALVLSLVGCGTVVYLRDDFFSLLSVETWLWGSTGGYFQAVALSATVFTLLLAFRVARLVSRTRDEVGLCLSVFRKLQYLVVEGRLAPDVLHHAAKIGGSQSAELKVEYDALRQRIACALVQVDSESRERLLSAQSELDSFVHSRQQGINFSDMASLVIFAGITVSMALFTRPNVSGLTGLLVELFTILFASVIIFLTANVRDLQKERISRLLEESGGPDRYAVVFDDAASRLFERVVSVGVGIAVTVAYGGLLGSKWMS